MDNRPIAQQLIDQWNNFPPQTPIQNSPPPHLTSKEAMLENIEHGVWTVNFIKVDGTESTMDVTLDQAYIPLTEQVDPTKPHVDTQHHLIKAYSPDRGGWRSFVVQNVKSIRQK